MGHGQEHSAVDLQAENQTQLDGKSCVYYAHDRAKEYAAVLRFIGLLAGIGSDEDVAEARRLVREALSEIGLETDARQALRNREYAGIAQRNAEQALGDARAAWEWSGDRDTAWAAAGSPTGADFNRWLETGPGVPANVMEAARNRRIAAENFDNAVRTHDEAARQLIKDLFAGLWEGFKSAYNNAVASIRNGTWKTALCKLGVDAGFLIAETAVGAAIAAVLTPAVAAALKFVGKVAQQGSHLVRIGIQATRTRLAQSNAKAFAERRFSRQIDTSKELTEVEKRVLGAENQGTTTATPDAGPSQPRAGAIAPSAWTKKDVLGRRVYQRDDLFDPKFVDDAGMTNVQRMQNGFAPIGKDGNEINLHHLIQSEPGPMIEMLKTTHQANSRVLHMYANQYDKTWRDADGIRRGYQSAPETMNRALFDRWKRQYWMERAADFQQ